MNILKNIDIDKIFDYTNFDIFKLKDKLGLENVMPFLGKEIVKKLNIIHLIEESKLDNFLMTLSLVFLPSIIERKTKLILNINKDFS